MKRTSFKSNPVIQYLNENFIPISVNTDQEPSLAKKWKVKGLPLIWFLEPDGKKNNYVAGYVDKNQLLTMLRYIHTNSDETLSYREFLDRQ